MAVKTGTNNNDTLTGTKDRDTITGAAGIDVLSGLGGDDTINGGTGNDTLDGGDGNDTLDGGADNDRLLGGVGKDTLIGGDGQDYLDGGADDDSLSGGAGDDTILGGTGKDTIYGGDANDTIDGGADNDTIFGEAGDDKISGGAGDDKISGGDGNDSIDAGDGNDSVDGGQGADIIRGGAGYDILSGGNDYDTIWGDAGNDTLSGGSGGDTIYGGDGRDLVYGGTENDVIYGDDPDAPPSQTARAGTTGTLTAQNFASYWTGVDVTARNVDSNGLLTEASASNVGIYADGIGASSTYNNGPSVTAETGYNPAKGVSEQLIISFDHDVNDANVALSWFFTNEGERGRYTVLDDGVVVGTALFSNTTGGSDFTLSIDAVSTAVGGAQAHTTSTLNVAVTAVADAPILASNDGNAFGFEDQPIALNIAAVLADTDGSESISSVVISGVPDGASLSAGVQVSPGTWALTSNQLAGLTMMPSTGALGDITLTVSATSTEQSNGDQASSTSSLIVNVSPVNDAPLAVNDHYTGLKDTPITIDALSGVLANDSDPNDTPANNLSAQIVSGPAHGTITLNADGSFIYTPNAGFFGADHFTYTAVDDGGTSNGGQDTSNVATVNLFLDLPVGQANAPPVALDSTVYGVQDEPVGGQVGATDADHNLQDLTFTILTGPQHGTLTFNADGTFLYTPTAGFSGYDDFTFKVTDPYGASDVGVGYLDIAQITPPPQFQPTDFSGPTKDPVIASLANGNFIIAWGATDLDGPGPGSGDGSSDGVFFQMFTAGGSPIGGAIMANTTTLDTQGKPSVTGLPDGTFLVTWAAANQDGDQNGIFGQRFDADGHMISRDGTTLGSDEFGLNALTAGDQYNPVVAAMSDGGWVATWSTQTGADYEVFQRVFDSHGQPLATETQVNTYTLTAQYLPGVTVLADGGYIVAYQSFFQDYVENGPGSGALADYGIYAQRYDAHGNPVGRDGLGSGLANFRISDTLAGNQTNVHLTALANGGFAAVWDSDANPGGNGQDIVFKVYNADGSAATGEVIVNHTIDGNQFRPDIAILSDGSFFITWQSDQESDGTGIYGQRVLADGTLAGAEYHINTALPNNQTLSVVQGLENGGFVISWQTQVGGGNNVEQISARLFGESVEGMRDLSGGTGNDVVTGSPLNDSINTTGGNDIINGRDGNDIIIGGLGADQMTGGAGADTFVWHSEQDGSFFNQLDAVADFRKSDGDKLDFSAFVTLNGGDVADFVHLTEQDGNTIVSVDVDGALNGQNFQAVVLLQNVTGLEVHELKDDNHLVVTL